MAFDKTAYDAAFQRANYDRINLLVPKGRKETIKHIADSNGVSISQCIIRALEGYYGVDLSKN